MAEEEAIMKKRLALLLAVVLTFGTIFTGCGSKEESKESEDVTEDAGRYQAPRSNPCPRAD